MNRQALIKKIKQHIHLAQDCKGSYEVLHAQNEPSDHLHEFLFFIKPEITLKNDAINLDALLDLVFEKFEQFGLRIRDTRLLAASYLESKDIIAQHYGVINALSRNPLEYLSKEARERFTTLFGRSPEQSDVLGSIEFLQRYPDHTPFTLDELWQRSKTEKLAGGTYCAAVHIEGQDVYLINGFHPKQLIHFTEKGRSIVAFTLTGDLHWNIARNHFIGKTNPADALPGSLRRELLDRKQEFGLQSVSASQNGFHLSAGPVEGLVELIRYCSDYEAGTERGVNDFRFGRQLMSIFSEEEIKQICSNHLVEYRGEKIRTFDLTEEKNSAEAITLLKESRF